MGQRHIKRLFHLPEVEVLVGANEQLEIGWSVPKYSSYCHKVTALHCTCCLISACVSHQPLGPFVQGRDILTLLFDDVDHRPPLW